MRYIKAEEILPAEVIALIQEYADGVTIYIPRKTENRRAWGTAYRAELEERNGRIRAEYAQGTAPAALAERFHLSEKTIRRILRT